MQRELILMLSLVLYSTAATGDVLKQEIDLDTPAPPGSLTDDPDNNTLYVCSGNYCKYDDCISLQNKNENWDEIKACPLSPRASCSCAANSCSCCIHIKLDALNINGNLCVELVYTEAADIITAILKWNDVTYFSFSVPRPSKEPFCVALPIPNINVCASVTDITFSGGSPHFCADLTLNVYEKPILTVTLGCFKSLPNLGQDVHSGNLLVPADVPVEVNNNPTV